MTSRNTLIVQPLRLCASPSTMAIRDESPSHGNFRRAMSSTLSWGAPLKHHRLLRGQPNMGRERRFPLLVYTTFTEMRASEGAAGAGAAGWRSRTLVRHRGHRGLRRSASERLARENRFPQQGEATGSTMGSRVMGQQASIRQGV